MSTELPPIPPKRYFTIGEVSELCAVKPYVLRYWEQEFTQLRPMKRRGNRRYYQHHEVLLVRRIRELLYEKRFTISGARDRLAESQLRAGAAGSDTADFNRGDPAAAPSQAAVGPAPVDSTGAAPLSASVAGSPGAAVVGAAIGPLDFDLRRELMAIRRMLSD